MRRVPLLLLGDFEHAEAELKSLGGRVAHVLADRIVVSHVPDHFDPAALESSAVVGPLAMAASGTGLDALRAAFSSEISPTRLIDSESVAKVVGSLDESARLAVAAWRAVLEAEDKPSPFDGRPWDHPEHTAPKGHVDPSVAPEVK